jgi:hypothetical protein
MSFSSPAGKPIDFARGRRLLAWACAQERTEPDPSKQWFEAYRMFPAREDLIAGYVEHDGKRLDDPHFAASNVVALPKHRQSKAAADLEKAVAIIAALEAQFGAAFPVECAEATEFLLGRAAA